MTTPALRRAWKEWRAFADGLDLADGSPDGAALHGRLFRLSGNHPLRAKHLQATQEALQAALEPWLGPPGAGADELEALRRALAACEPAWRALLGVAAGQPTPWDEVERVARAAGLAWPEEAFWRSLLFVTGKSFEPVTALRGRDHDEAVALLAALLRVLNHPHGGPLWAWLSGTPALNRPAQALHAAALFRDAVDHGALRGEWVRPLGWLPLVTALRQLAEEVCLCLLRRLNESLPAAARPAPAGRPAPATHPTYRRAVPDPLPVEPYFRQIRGSEAFLRAIAEEPLEDVHRLALADWLDDHGHAARAAFIRLQCQAEQLPDDHVGRRRLDEQAEALLDEHGAAWVAGLPRCGEIRWGALGHFRRGMLERVEFEAGLDPQAYQTAFTALDVRQVRQGGLDRLNFPAFLGLPWLARLVSLELYLSSYNGPYEGADMRALAGSAGLAGLARLSLSGSGLGSELVTALVEALRLPALTSLDLENTSVGPEGARALAGCATLGQLRQLRLGRNDLHLEGVRALAASPALANLTALDLGFNELHNPGVEALANSPFLTNLTSLNLYYNSVGIKGATALAKSPLLGRLSYLGLGANRLFPKAVRALARSPHLAGLSVLRLSSNADLGDEGEGVRALAESPHVAGLRSLDLSRKPLTAEAVHALAESPHLVNLEALSLRSTGLDHQGARALAASPHLNKLWALDLEENALPRGARAALRKRWPFAWL